MRETNRTHDDLVKKVGKCRKRFEKVKHERLTAFMTCYDHVSNKIELVYKVQTYCDSFYLNFPLNVIVFVFLQSLTQGPSATALLTLSDMEEPFNGDMQYCCIIPGKPCCPMSSFSGGEKTLSSLSLLFALRR